jgi:hypothetical protein
MTDESRVARWQVYVTQAQNFEQRENYLEAVSRMGVVAREAADAIATATGPADEEQARYYLLFAQKQKQALQAKLDAWNGRIAARRQAEIANAPAEMARPLPNPPPPPRR